jgi:hypothetical protein
MGVRRCSARHWQELLAWGSSGSGRSAGSSRASGCRTVQLLGRSPGPLAFPGYVAQGRPASWLQATAVLGRRPSGRLQPSAAVLRRAAAGALGRLVTVCEPGERLRPVTAPGAGDAVYRHLGLSFRYSRMGDQGPPHAFAGMRRPRCKSGDVAGAVCGPSQGRIWPIAVNGCTRQSCRSDRGPGARRRSGRVPHQNQPK